MDPTIISALIGAAGGLLGAVIGIVTSARLTAYRLEQLEKEVRRHNDFARRMPVVEEQVKVANHRIADLEAAERDLEKERWNEHEN